MAVRTISTRLAVTGEADYKKAISSCNSELSVLKSNLSLTSAQFKGQENSVAALTAKGRVLADTYEKQKAKVATLESALSNAQKAQAKYTDQIAEAKQNIDRCEKSLSELSDSSEDSKEQQVLLTSELEKWKKTLQDAESRQEAATRGVNNWQKQLNNANTDLLNTNNQLQENSKYLSEAEKSADGYATSIDGSGKAVKKTEDSINTLSAALATAGVAAGIKEIADTLRDCASASIEFESAVTGVFKTVDGTPEQLQEISDGIKQMSLVIPASTTEIAAVAEAAGQLGVKTDDILNFTEVMVKLGTATNMTAEEAATQLAKLANITGMSEENYGKLGATIVGLGNNFATTESDIVAMSTRLAAAGKLSGLTESEILALAASMSSVGIEAEAGGTAMTQTLSAIEKAVAKGGEEVSEFARISGMSAQEFSSAWRTSPMVAIQAFIAGVGKLDEAGESATIVLDDMGLSGIRQSNMIKSLALASDKMGYAVELSNKAWKENNALNEEASKRYATTESKLKLTQNAATNLKAAVGSALTPTLNVMAEAGTEAFSWAAEFVEKNPWIVSCITGLTTAITVLSAGIAGLIIIKQITALMATLNITMAANPALLVASAISGLVVALGTLAASAKDSTSEFSSLKKELKESKESYDELSESLTTQSKNIDGLVASLDKAMAVEEKTAAQKAVVLSIVEQLNEAVPEMGLAYDEASDSINKTTASIKNLAKQKAKTDEFNADVARLSELYIEQESIETKLAEATEVLRVAQQNHSVDTSFLEQNIRALTKSQEENVAQIEVLESKHANYSETTTQAASSTENMGIAVDDLNARMQALQTAYEESRDKALESINQQIGLFQQMDGSAQTSIQNLIGSLESQSRYLEDYANNIVRAMEIGVDEGLVKKLSDGREESAQILAAIVSGGQTDIDKLNNEFRNVQIGKEKFSGTVAEMETDFDESMKNIEETAVDTVNKLNLSIEAQESGRDTIQGYIDGAESLRGSLISKYQSLARAANRAYRKELDINSPSRKFRKSGRESVEGAILGAEDERANLESTYRALAESAINAYNASLPSSEMIAIAQGPKKQITSNEISSRQNSDNSVHYGQVKIIVYGAPGQSEAQIAEIVAEKINATVQQKGAAFPRE